VKAHLLILSIVLAIAVQNTCPYGWAAKTAFTAGHGCPCHLHDQSQSDHKSDHEDAKKDLPTAKQLFLFGIADTYGAVQRPASATRAESPQQDTAREIFPEPPVRPPVPFPLS
jgi:hypothetical protein